MLFPGCLDISHSDTARTLGQEVSKRGQEKKQEVGKGQGKASPLALQMLMRDCLPRSSREVCSLTLMDTRVLGEGFFQGDIGVSAVLCWLLPPFFALAVSDARAALPFAWGRGREAAQA